MKDGAFASDGPDAGHSTELRQCILGGREETILLRRWSHGQGAQSELDAAQGQHWARSALGSGRRGSGAVTDFVTTCSGVLGCGPEGCGE
jgi:hypothetical protein